MKHALYVLFFLTLALAVSAQETPQEGDDRDTAGKPALPTAFQYSALIYQEGKPVAEKEIVLQAKLQDGAGEVFYIEQLHTTTDKSGAVCLTIGAGKGSVLQGEMATVPWERGLWVAADVQLSADGVFVSLGQAVPLQAVPYALYANSVPVVKGTKAGKEAGRAIFQVQSHEGMPLFSVYEEGVTLNVPMETTRRPRGGFAVRSFRRALRGESPVYTLTDRLKIADGAFQAFVDPDGETRRPRGGFVVMTCPPFRGETPKNDLTQKLLQVAAHETYLTIDKCDVGSTFQFRERAATDQIVMNITKEGKIETLAKKEDVIVKPRPTLRENGLTLFWPFPDTYGVGATAQSFGFTNLIRYRMPVVKMGNKPVNNENLEIEVVDDPTDSRKLSDYIKAGTYTTGETMVAIKQVKGVMLAENFKLLPDFVFPKGKIRIRTTGLEKNKEINFAIPEGMKMLTPDKENMVLGVGVGFDGKENHYTYNSADLHNGMALDIIFTEQRTPDEKVSHTDGANLVDLFMNLGMTCRPVGACADYLRVEKTSAKDVKSYFKLIVTDVTKLRASVDVSDPTNPNTVIDLEIIFPDGLYESVRTSTALIIR